jgi:hypothetical protein
MVMGMIFKNGRTAMKNQKKVKKKTLVFFLDQRAITNKRKVSPKAARVHLEKNLKDAVIV